MVTLAFLSTSLLVLLTPGPTNTVLAACGASMGFRRAAMLPLAEAIGYVAAISFFVFFAERMQGNPFALGAVRLAAAVWLVHAAIRLWRTPFEQGPAAREVAFRRVLLTTLINPKAMLVGTVLIPAGLGAGAGLWIAAYAVLSTLAGLGWVALGSSLPSGVRRHGYKLASVILGGFSVVALATVAGT